MKDIRLLTKDEIEVKVKQVFAKGAVALLYKTSRTDMNVLDETFGPSNWTNDYRDIDGVLYCGIGAREDESKPFVWKWSNGIESRKDDEGNEVKGEASDALKRAGFLWGIGRELYSAPFTWLDVETVKNEKGKYDLADKKARFYVDAIEYDSNRKICLLRIIDQTGAKVFFWKDKKTGDDAPYYKNKKDDCSDLPFDLHGKKEMKRPDGMVDEAVIADIYATGAKAGYDKEDIFAGVKDLFGKDYPEDMTVVEANRLLKMLEGAIHDNHN